MVLSIFFIMGYRTIVFIFCYYFHNVSVAMSPGLLQVFVKLGNLHGTLNYVLYWILGGLLAITEYKCYVFMYCYSPAVRIEPATSCGLSLYKLREPTPITVTLCVLLHSSEGIFGNYKRNVLTWLGLLQLCLIVYLCSYSDFSFFFFLFK